MTVLDTTVPALPAPGSAVSAADPVGPADAADEPALRALRTALLEETLRLQRWQRLVRARLDLATDRLSPAEALREAGRAPAASGQGDERGPDVAAGPADVAALVALVRGQVGSATDAADDLCAVVATHRVLRARALDLAGRLAAVDAALAGHGTARRCCPRG